MIKVEIFKIKKAMRVEEWFTMFFDEELSGESLLIKRTHPENSHISDFHF